MNPVRVAFIAVIAFFALILITKTRPDQTTVEPDRIAALEARIDQLDATIGDLQGVIAATATVTQANDATLASWVEQVNADIVTLQVAVVDNPAEIVNLVGRLNDRLDDLAIYLNGGQNASILLEGVDLTGLEDQCIGGCPQPSALLAAPEAQTAPVAAPTTTTEPQTTGRTFHPAVEQWRGLVELYFPSWAVDEALLVMDNESDGCPTARAFSGCPGKWLPRTSGSICAATGLWQHCTGPGPGYWDARVASYPECVPIEMSIDPACNAAATRVLWEQSGCTFRTHWPSTSNGTGRGCGRGELSPAPLTLISLD